MQEGIRKGMGESNKKSHALDAMGGPGIISNTRARIMVPCGLHQEGSGTIASGTPIS